jgi:hypothetical protein
VQAIVSENASDTADLSDVLLIGGSLVPRPPHSVEAIVLGGLDAVVAATVWASKGGGIATWGTTLATVVDASGANRAVRYSRPEDRVAFAEVAIEVDAARYAGDAAVAAAIESYVATLGIGETLELSAIPAVVRDVRGVRNLQLGSVKLGWSGGTRSQQDLAPRPRQRVSLPAANVTVSR